MNSTDLAFTPATEQAQLIRSKQISPLELVELYLDRIATYDSQLGSYFTVMTEEAIADAKVKTETLAKNPTDLPPFFGVPIPVKDLKRVQDVRCSFGVPALKNEMATEDDGIVTKLRQAGFILLGKTATSQVGSMPFTEPPGFPPTRNPWNLDHTSGGSSGGASSALAAGLCPIAHGSDGGGSVRGPAACCGVVGLKPSRGRITSAPLGDSLHGLATNGILARTIADTATLLDAMAGYVTGDPYWLPDPLLPFSQSYQQPPTSLRIAFSPNLSDFGQATPEYQQAVTDTAKVLADLGHHLEEACPVVADIKEPFTTIWQSGVAASGLPLELLEPINQWLASRTVNAGQYLQAVRALQMISRRIVSFWDSYDVLLLPVYLHPPIKVGEWAALEPAQMFAKVSRWIAPCAPFNATGQPAIALPVGFGDRGLPLSIQLIGRPGAEATLLSLAAQLETIYNWGQYRPPMALEMNQ
ncbi:amidase [Roseofilum sp. BLCC_M154]|uniref:Amidase n=1 Tax=Roseofilum acuticapitatum BLCC-M154 TaxID=3022444 RepID=A0ABT7ATZ5_9CYAN|nr:amidase [Roseofilum acuticapitatum]MDJ1170388.1 amidase [Roseofilum acuticapitatum BLCC-M154]